MLGPRADGAYLPRTTRLAALIAEATNIGLGRAEVCRVASRRTLTMAYARRDIPYGLTRVVEILHREPADASFGTDRVSSSDGPLAGKAASSTSSGCAGFPRLGEITST
jgi:hypothetical protein